MLSTVATVVEKWRVSALAKSDVRALRMTRDGLESFLQQNPLAQVSGRVGGWVGGWVGEPGEGGVGLGCQGVPRWVGGQLWRVPLPPPPTCPPLCGPGLAATITAAMQWMCAHIHLAVLPALPARRPACVPQHGHRPI